MTDDHFQRLDLPRRFSLDTADLDARYLARCRTFHPDQYARSSGGELQLSQMLSAALNESYKLLRDPFRRADHLVTLLGGPSADDEKQADPAFLEEMLELRMRIEEAKSDGATRDQMRQELTARRDHLLNEVGANLDGPSPDLKSARRQLNAAKYVIGLLRDLG